MRFQALVFRPFKGEVLDGQVVEISNDGFMVESGPIKSFISNVVNDSTLWSNLFHRELSNNSYMTRASMNLFQEMTQTRKLRSVVKSDIRLNKLNMTRENM